MPFVEDAGDGARGGLADGFTHDIITRLANLDQDFESMERRARFFHDEIDAKLAAETNRQLYILSALTALFLPPTLVAGLFGMNVKGIWFADEPWAFDAIAISCLAIAAVTGLWFIKQRWFRK